MCKAYVQQRRAIAGMVLLSKNHGNKSKATHKSSLAQDTVLDREKLSHKNLHEFNTKD